MLDSVDRWVSSQTGQRCSGFSSFLLRKCRAEGTARAYLRTSASSRFDFRVQGLQFCACVVDLELPIDASLLAIGVYGPGLCFFSQLLDCGESSSLNTLARHAAQFVFGDVEPTAVFGRETQLDSLRQLKRSLRWKCFIESADRVRVEIVTNNDEFLRVNVPRCQ